MCSIFVRIMAVARLELRGILRSHPLRIFVPTAVLVVLAGPSLVLFAFAEREAMIAQLGVSTAALVSILVGLLAGSAGLAADRHANRRDLLLAGRLTTGEYVAGKWLGITAVGFLCVGLLGGVHIAHLLVRGTPRIAPLLPALLLAGVQGGLAAALALCFSAFLRAGPALLSALGIVLASHAISLTARAGVLEAVLPRLPRLHLAAEAAFGPLSSRLFLAALAHGVLYTVFLLAIAVPLAQWSGGD